MTTAGTELGTQLRQLREALGMSLRDVWQVTKISSGHLSLIETGKVRNPSPTVLQRLAVAYKTDARDLLVLAGYLPKESPSSRHQAGARVALASLRDLDDEELGQVQTFVQILRQRKKQKALRQGA